MAVTDTVTVNVEESCSNSSILRRWATIQIPYIERVDMAVR